MSFPDLQRQGRRKLIFAALGVSAVVLTGAARQPTTAAGAPPHGGGLLRDAPPLGHTGGFGEPTCRQCHWDNDLDHASGAVTVEGLPTRFQPGMRYRVTIVVRHTELAAAGFQLSARYQSGALRGRQAGTLRALDTRVGITVNDTTAVQYAHHRRPGTTPVEGGMGRWTIEWIAPAAPAAAVTLHVAANAANDNDSELGDYVYHHAVTVPSAEK